MTDPARSIVDLIPVHQQACRASSSSVISDWHTVAESAETVLNATAGE